MDLDSSTNVRFDNWPVRDEWRVSTLLLLVLVAVAVGAGFAMENVLLGCGVLLALLVCTAEMWVPTRIEIGPEGVSVRSLARTRHLAWENVAACELFDRGVLLRTTVGGAPLARQGAFLRYGANRQGIVEELRANHPELFGEQDEFGFNVHLPAPDSYYAEFERETDSLNEDQQELAATPGESASSSTGESSE